MTVTEPSHPAKFSASIQKVLAGRIDAEAVDRDMSRPLRVLDPFAGVGRIHRLPYERDHFTVGVELECEWALAGGSVPADATRLPFRSDSVDVVATSCCYGNRMADTYDGSRDTCTDCDGIGLWRYKAIHTDCFIEDRACQRCNGTGLAPSRRQTYRISLGRPLSENNAGGLQWGSAYRALHVRAWAEARRVLASGGLFLLNVSNHVRGGRVQPVVEWHLQTLLGSGLLLVDAVPVATQRMRHGQNHAARVGAEMVLALRA